MITVDIKLVYSIAGTLAGQVRERAALAVGTTAAQVLSDARISMTGAKHGRIYHMGKVTHQASAPGEAPAIDTGALSNSGYVERLDELTREVGFSAEYASVLEGAEGQFIEGGYLDLAEALGVWAAPNPDEILPRPFLIPAIEKNRDSFETAMRKVLQ